MLPFWIFMLCMTLLIPLVMVAFGAWFSFKSPKHINALFGYRTTMSMKNTDTWNFAHRFCGRLWLLCGLVMLPLSLIPMAVVFGHSNEVIGIVSTVLCCIQLISLLASVIPTEIALHKTFDQNGNRK